MTTNLGAPMLRRVCLLLRSVRPRFRSHPLALPRRMPASWNSRPSGVIVFKDGFLLVIQAGRGHER